MNSPKSGITAKYSYDFVNRITNNTTANASTAYTYDTFGRLGTRVNSHGENTVLSTTLGYRVVGTGSTGQVSSLTLDAAGYDKTLSYTYSVNGNILSVSDRTNTTSYVYDTAGQLLRENNPAAGKTWVWTYDDGGNILSRKEYAYTTDTLGPVRDAVNYTYGNSNWGDQLTAYDGQTISYDNIGNPLDDGTWEYTWEHGRQLKSMKSGSTTWTYGYDADGLRYSRSNSTSTWQYIYIGDQLAYCEEKVGTQVVNRIHFQYDANGTPVSMQHGSTYYYYVTNLQGDVIALLDTSGTAVVEYTYNAWGKLLSITGSKATTVGTLNPLRYRGYVYDTETGLYYVSSRYYNPEIGRWINADSLASTGQDFLGNNMFAYCLNNPVLLLDSAGMRAVLNTRGWGGSNENCYYSDGKARSDEVLAYFRKAESKLNDYPDYRMTVTSNGICYKTTDHSVEYANYLVVNLLLCSIPVAGIFFSAVGFVSGFIEINDAEVFPDGYYDTYTISLSWTDIYEWNGGKTYTYYSYEFVVCWDAVSDAEPRWQLHRSVDRTQTEVVYD